MLKETPEISTINLEFCEIERVEPLLPYLNLFPNLEELILFGNRIEHLPADLDKLKNLQKLDISNNLFTSISSVIEGLKSLPSLKSLHMTLLSDSDQSELSSSLPNLLYLNDNLIKKDEEYSIKQQDLEKIALIYDDIRAVWRKINADYDQTLAKDFDEGIKNIMEELSEIAKSRCPSSLLSVHMLSSKFRLYKLCLNKSTEYVKTLDSEIGNIFGTVFEEFEDIQ